MDFSAGWKRAPSCTSKGLPLLLVFMFFVVVSSDGSILPNFDLSEFSSSLQSLAKDTGDGLGQYLESIAGISVVQVTLEMLQKRAVKVLNAVVDYLSKVMSMAGMDANVLLPRFRAEDIIPLAKWGLMPLLGYWKPSLLLKLGKVLLSWSIWLTKIITLGPFSFFWKFFLQFLKRLLKSIGTFIFSSLKPNLSIKKGLFKKKS
ncbi:uncharacterized protein LOC114768553 [Denticeps clupeoides]|uniref:uncharacterized protein LOC114768553 n=1 Tax=Denticeps clupeoides TaxID=299321 RepID=UPI0010A505B9|nr:uncharacterized protein LOC114768553 [Denticeps clupeoides]